MKDNSIYPDNEEINNFLLYIASPPILEHVVSKKELFFLNIRRANDSRIPGALNFSAWCEVRKNNLAPRVLFSATKALRNLPGPATKI